MCIECEFKAAREVAHQAASELTALQKETTVAMDEVRQTILDGRLSPKRRAAALARMLRKACKLYYCAAFAADACQEYVNVADKRARVSSDQRAAAARIEADGAAAMKDVIGRYAKAAEEDLRNLAGLGGCA